LKFTFDNEYSWFREKLVSYRVSVTPPSAEVLLAGRRRRTKACQKAIIEDLTSAKQRLEAATTQKITLEADISKLEKQLQEKKKSLEVVAKEESWLKTRVQLRAKQQQLLEQRLTKGWDDENGLK
jgi:chromosome segregation ATPase